MTVHGPLLIRERQGGSSKKQMKICSRCSNALAERHEFSPDRQTGQYFRNDDEIKSLSLILWRLKMIIRRLIQYDSFRIIIFWFAFLRTPHKGLFCIRETKSKWAIIRNKTAFVAAYLVGKLNYIRVHLMGEESAAPSEKHLSLWSSSRPRSVVWMD